jgi:hypothetical protein
MVKKEGEGGNKEEGIWFITVEVTNMPPLTMKVKPKTKISKLVEVRSVSLPSLPPSLPPSFLRSGLRGG